LKERRVGQGRKEQNEKKTENKKERNRNKEKTDKTEEQTENRKQKKTKTEKSKTIQRQKETKPKHQPTQTPTTNRPLLNPSPRVTQQSSAQLNGAASRRPAPS
jgi:hypothetical protein